MNEAIIAQEQMFSLVFEVKRSALETLIEPRADVSVGGNWGEV